MRLLRHLTKWVPIIVLIIVVSLGFFIRAWKLDSAPRGALIDELHFGYLAKSLIETGKDEHGTSWSLIFKGFGDQKLPALAYADIPAIMLFGTTVTAIRVPTLLAGVLLIIACYYLLRELGFEQKWSVMGAFITAISPWTFFLSRFGFESNLALLFFVVGLITLLKGLKTKQSGWYISTGIFLGLTWYSYIAYRPITAAVLVLFGIYLLVSKQFQRKYLYVLVAFGISILPLFSPQIVGVNNARFKQVGVPSDPGLVLAINEKRTFCAMQFPRFVCDAAWNKPTLVARTLANYYFASFSADFLASVGEGEEYFALAVEDFGQLYSVTYPFFIIGLAALLFVKDKSLKKAHIWLFWIGLLLAPLPTVFVGEPQKVRLSAMYPFVLIACIYGMKKVSELLKPRILSSGLFVIITAFLSIHAFIFLTEYYSVHTIKHEYYYQSYLRDLYAYLETLPEDTLINIRPFFSDPLMFYAFYTDMDPAKYQQQAVLGVLEPTGFQHTVEIGNVQAYDISIDAVGCKGRKAGITAVHVTDIYMPDAKLLYQGKATNGVHTYVYVYDATASLKANSCDSQQM
jgi:hypothetical protein